MAAQEPRAGGAARAAEKQAKREKAARRERMNGLEPGRKVYKDARHEENNFTGNDYLKLAQKRSALNAVNEIKEYIAENAEAIKPPDFAPDERSAELSAVLELSAMMAPEEVDDEFLSALSDRVAADRQLEGDFGMFISEADGEWLAIDNTLGRLEAWKGNTREAAAGWLAMPRGERWDDAAHTADLELFAARGGWRARQAYDELALREAKLKEADALLRINDDTTIKLWNFLDNARTKVSYRLSKKGGQYWAIEVPKAVMRELCGEDIGGATFFVRKSQIPAPENTFESRLNISAIALEKIDEEEAEETFGHLEHGQLIELYGILEELGWLAECLPSSERAAIRKASKIEDAAERGAAMADLKESLALRRVFPLRRAVPRDVTLKRFTKTEEFKQEVERFKATLCDGLEPGTLAYNEAAERARLEAQEYLLPKLGDKRTRLYESAVALVCTVAEMAKAYKEVGRQRHEKGKAEAAPRKAKFRERDDVPRPAKAGETIQMDFGEHPDPESLGMPSEQARAEKLLAAKGVKTASMLEREKAGKAAERAALEEKLRRENRHISEVVVSRAAADPDEIARLRLAVNPARKPRGGDVVHFTCMERFERFREEGRIRVSGEDWERLAGRGRNGEVKMTVKAARELCDPSKGYMSAADCGDLMRYFDFDRAPATPLVLQELRAAYASGDLKLKASSEEISKLKAGYPREGYATMADVEQMLRAFVGSSAVKERVRRAMSDPEGLPAAKPSPAAARQKPPAEKAAPARDAKADQRPPMHRPVITPPGLSDWTRRFETGKKAAEGAERPR